MTGATTAAAPGPVPTLPGDQTLGFLRDGYAFGARRFDELGTDAFRARLAGLPMLVLRGVEGARFFAEEDRFSRADALPRSVLHSLQDAGSVQTLSGSAHRARKALFLDLLDAPSRARLRALLRDEWESALPQWRRRGTIRLHEEAAGLLTRAVCRWAGLPLDADDARVRTREFLAMLDGAGSFGPRNWWGRTMRLRTERWARELIRHAREDATGDAPSGVVARLLEHRDPGGLALGDEVAAIELINLLRPTVAVGRFIVFAALALHLHPEWAERFRDGDEQHLRGFVQEVRRTAPFFPMLAGRATQELDWHGERIAEGSLVALDIFATHRDPTLWQDPLRFRPERHAGPSHADALIAQGAGDMATAHRCPGEPLAIELIEEGVRLLTRRTAYDVPPQDLGVNLRRLPTLPRSGFVMSDIRAG